MYADVRVIIMTKAPVSGQVKTRLMTHYTADEAAAIYRAMATVVIERAQCLFCDIWLAADDPQHAFFQTFSLPVRAQGGGDLGWRMTRLMQEHFRQCAKPVLFLGCDSPHMPDVRLHQAVSQLLDHDVVIGPVEDGGYDLIALRDCHAGMFADIPWSTADVLERTRRQARALDLHYCELNCGFDIDTPEDLLRSGFLPRSCNPLII